MLDGVICNDYGSVMLFASPLQSIRADLQGLRAQRLFCSHEMWVEKCHCLQAEAVLFASRHTYSHA